MSILVSYDPNATPPNRVTGMIDGDPADYEGLTFLVDPDLSSVQNLTLDVMVAEPGTNSVRRMTAAELLEENPLPPGGWEAMYDTNVVLRAIVMAMVEQFNVLRAEHGRPAITRQQVKQRLKQIIEAGEA